PTAVAPATRDAGVLASNLQQLAVASGGTVGVSVVELGGSDQLSWSFGGDAVITAASTYKLVALMMEAQSIAAGTTDPNGIVCFAPSDHEAGWFDDYEPGACFTRTELASSAATPSDATAGPLLMRELRPPEALNAWARVIAGPDGPYVLVVMTDGLGGDAGWQLIAAISAAVWQVESSRSQ